MSANERHSRALKTPDAASKRLADQWDLKRFIRDGGNVKDFKRFDTDDNGVLEGDELAAYFKMKKHNGTAMEVPSLKEWAHHSEENAHLTPLWQYVLLIFGVYLSVIIIAEVVAFELWDHDGELPSISALNAQEGLTEKASAPSPTHELSTLAFNRYLCLICATTMVTTGLGMEVVLGGYMVNHFTAEGGEILWHGAQYLFSMMLTVAIIGQSAFSFPFVVFGLWKFGFPETIGYLLKAWKTPSTRPVSRFMYFANGIGLLLHHSSGAFFVCALATGLMELVRVNLAGTIILVVQHWFVPVKYQNVTAYNVIEFVLEIYFELELISALPDMQPKNGVDTTARGCAIVMLTAHWLYLLAAFAEIFLLDLCGLEEGHVDESGGESFMELKKDMELGGTAGSEGKYGSNQESAPLAGSAPSHSLD